MEPLHLPDNKLLTDLTIEELEKSLETAVETQEVPEDSDGILIFLTKFNIRPGEELVHSNILYKLYKEVIKEPLTKIKFNNRLSEYIPTKVNGKGTKFYLLNVDSFKLSRDFFKLIESSKRNPLVSKGLQYHFDRFIGATNIVSGNYWVEGFIIYEIYRHYCIDKKLKKLLGYDSFHKFLKLNFEHRRVTSNRSLWFRVNEETIQLLTIEEQNEIRERRKKTIPKKERKSKKKYSILGS